MARKIIAILTAVAAATLVVGVAWASSGDDTSTSVTGAGSSTSTSADTATSDTSNISTPTTSDDTTSTSDVTVTTSGSTTSTTSDDTTSTSSGSTTSTSIGNTTSTSSGSTTSTSVDDNGGGQGPPDGQSTYSIPGLGTVTIAVQSGSLILVNVTAPGWTVVIEKEESDRIEIEFTNGEAEAEFEARIRGSLIEVEAEVDPD